MESKGLHSFPVSGSCDFNWGTCFVVVGVIFFLSILYIDNLKRRSDDC